jgi:predicted MFS family arabinose efflux permease
MLSVVGRRSDEWHGGALVRDRSTALSYGALGAYAFWLYAFGPAVALLRSDLHFSYAVVGIYSAAWAGGATLTSAGFAAIVARTGRRRLMWGSAVVSAAGAAIFALAHDVAWTLVGALVLGSAGTATQLTTQSVLSDRHGERRSQALVEANVGAGACAVLAPLALGGLATTAAGWRTAMAVPAVVFVALFAAYRRHPESGEPASGQATGAGSGAGSGGHPGGGVRRLRALRLPGTCCVLCFLVGVGIAVEFCVIYFGSELMATRTALSPTAAATAMTAFYAGILLGRVAGARIVRTAGRSVGALWGSVAVTVAGLVVVMTTGDEVTSVAGILVAGIGVANRFPLSVSLALSAAGPKTDVANGLSQVIGGVLVVVAPFVLGSLADAVGLTGAFAIAPALAVGCGALLAMSSLVGRRSRRQWRAGGAGAGEAGAGGSGAGGGAGAAVRRSSAYGTQIE